MKTAGACLMFAAWAGVGCVTLPAGWNEAKKPPSPSPVAQKLVQNPAPPPVRPEQVTDENARQMADNLAEELERDLNPEPAFVPDKR